MKKFKIALDWTPNTNHIGIFVADELGFFESNGIDVEIISPSEDNYLLTPGKKLETGLVDFAVAPFETVISLNNKSNQVDAVAVYAILQEDLSSVVTLKSSGITMPKLLDGKVYASYKARYEDRIVKEMIRNNGGEGMMHIIYPDKLGIWNTLLDGKADATWIFDNWEGVEVRNKNIELIRFSLSQFGIPYSYSPVIFTRNSEMTKALHDYTGFIDAVRKGYMYARDNQKHAVELLSKYLTENERLNIDLEYSLRMTAPHFGNEESCGKMHPQRIRSFLNWLAELNIEEQKILQQKLFTNELLSLEN